MEFLGLSAPLRFTSALPPRPIGVAFRVALSSHSLSSQRGRPIRETTVMMTVPRLARSFLVFAALLFVANAQSAERVSYVHFDALGSSVAATDEQGNIVWRETYQPYGERIRNEASAATNTRWYTGHPQDSETGLLYMGARYYDPVIGRFMGVDPVPFQESAVQSFNRYAYGANNPYKFTDPDGRRIQFAPGSTSQFQQQFGQMIQYLNTGGVAGTIAQLEARPETVLIQQSPTQHGFHYNPGTMTIVLDPLSGLEVSPGQVQTPALGLLHEAGHALQHLQNPTQLLQDAATPDAQYHTREERRVIVNIETPAAQKLNEPVRQHHGGNPVTVQCPICK